eukprot:3939395-Rhodomonas_salina.1
MERGKMGSWFWLGARSVFLSSFSRSSARSFGPEVPIGATVVFRSTRSRTDRYLGMILRSKSDAQCVCGGGGYTAVAVRAGQDQERQSILLFNDVSRFWRQKKLFPRPRSVWNNSVVAPHLKTFIQLPAGGRKRMLSVNPCW